MARTRRDITREATVREIKDTALRLMRAGGTTEVRFADIAREMSMSAPGLYRYFDGRDDLISALVADAFTDLAVTVAAARDGIDRTDPTGRLLAVATALRGWALTDRERFALIFGPPIPGYAAPEDGITTEAADRAMTVLTSVVLEAAGIGRLGPPLVTDVQPRLAAHFHPDKAGHDHGDIPAATMQAVLHCWAALHGVISLEVYGTLKFMGDACEGMFLGMVRLVAEFVGLPAPADGWPDTVPQVAAPARS